MAANQTPHINLLSSYVADRRRTKAKSRRIQSFSILILVCYLAVLGTLVVSRGLVRAKLERVEDDISQERLTIAQLKQIEDLHELVKNKVAIVNSLIGVKPLREQLIAIRSFLPDRVVLNSIKLGEQDLQSVQVGLQAEDMFALVPLIDEIETRVDDAEYLRVFVDSVSRADDGTYQVSAEFESSE